MLVQCWASVGGTHVHVAWWWPTLSSITHIIMIYLPCYAKGLNLPSNRSIPPLAQRDEPSFFILLHSFCRPLSLANSLQIHFSRDDSNRDKHDKSGTEFWTSLGATTLEEQPETLALCCIDVVPITVTLHYITSTAKARCWANVGLMLGHRLRRCPNRKPTVSQHWLNVLGGIVSTPLLARWIQSWKTASAHFTSEQMLQNSKPLQQVLLKKSMHHRVFADPGWSPYRTRIILFCQIEYYVTRDWCGSLSFCWYLVVTSSLQQGLAFRSLEKQHIAAEKMGVAIAADKAAGLVSNFQYGIVMSAALSHKRRGISLLQISIEW